jgi:hypothetical protein
MQTQLRFPMIDIPGHEGQRQWWNMLTFLPQIKSNQIKSNQKVLFKVGTFYNNTT